MFVAQPMTLKKNLALFFMMFFMLINSAPTIIISLDNTIDSSMLFGLGEEEEKEDIKLLLECVSEESECTSLDYINLGCIGYTFKTYLKPHPNLIFPPPKKRWT